jgi:hypothetical protein
MAKGWLTKSSMFPSKWVELNSGVICWAEELAKGDYDVFA